MYDAIFFSPNKHYFSEDVLIRKSGYSGQNRIKPVNSKTIPNRPIYLMFPSKINSKESKAIPKIIRMT